MRRLVLGGLLVALIAAPTALAFTGSSADAVRRPDLRLVDRYPFVVQGQHFRSGERVKVVLTTREQRSLMVRAGETGSFSANFGDVKIPSCTGFLVRAYGVRGSRAQLHLPAPDCMPVGKPDSKPDQGTR
jgi:hypothetical protein